MSIIVDLSDHQLIYCTRKVLHPKSTGHQQIKIRSLKFTSLMNTLPTRHFQTVMFFTDVNAAYSDFTDKLMYVTDKIASIRKVSLKNEVVESIKGRLIV